MMHFTRSSNSPIPPPITCKTSRPSPRKIRVETIARLAKPTMRVNSNLNSSMNEYGERLYEQSKIEGYYSDLLDKVSNDVCVPKYMYRKMILAIIEAEKPDTYCEMKNYHKHYMTCSAEKQRRAQRQKATMRRPPSLLGKKHVFNEEIKIRGETLKQDFADKLLQVIYIFYKWQSYDV